MTHIFTSEISPFWVGAGGMNIYISCPLWSFQTIFFCWNKNKNRGDNIAYRLLFPLSVQSALPLITRTDDRPALPVIKSSLLVVFLSSNYLYVFAICKTKEARKFFNSLKKTNILRIPSIFWNCKIEQWRIRTILQSLALQTSNLVLKHYIFLLSEIL